MKAFITLPLYHNHGICNLYRAVYCGMPIHMFNADLPLTHDYLVKIMTQQRFEIFYGVPYALKLLAESEDGIKALQQLRIVMYGGSACPDDLGDMLVGKGVNLIGHYGSTEVGQLMTSFRPPGDRAWNYVREHPRLTPFLRWLPQGPNLFECCVAPGWPAKVATNMDDGSYATKDLFEPHPTIPQAWKYIARRDDTINLINGEMFNPVSTEGSIRSNKNVQEAVIFGAGRPSLGVLLVPASALRDEPEGEILDTIWPVVESACANVEAYARISKNMIKLLPWDCAYPRTDKGSIIRQAFYRDYAEEIEQIYEQAEKSGAELSKMSLLQLQGLVRGLVTDALAKKVEMTDDSDFFALGLDSLQAIRIRSEIVKTVDVGGHRLGQTVVFDNPSVARLSSYLFALSSGTHANGDKPIESEMQDLIDRFSKIHSPTPIPRSSIIVTGVTGSLGAHIVTKMVSDPTIRKVYCLVRAETDHHASRRMISSLLQRRVYHTIPLLHRKKLLALASDTANPTLGLSSGTYRKIAGDLRLIIHSAWPVNFNMRLSSFQDSGIASVTNLISLCRAAGNGVSFNFCSSVSTVSRATTVPVPESLPNLEWAQDMGYAQSKSVAENICLRAADEQSGSVPTRVLRLGQIVGDTEHGVWNATEAIPLMIQSALTIGALPKLSETPSWLPVDVIAQAVTDISLSDAQGSVFTNVTNPKTFHWTNDLLPALKKAGLLFEEVEPKEWVRRLRESNTDPEANPPIKLVDFFASKYDKDEFFPSKTYATERACDLSPSLAASPVLDQKLVDNFVNYFQNGPWVAAKQKTLASVAKPTSTPADKTVIVIAGPCGSGKSTVAATLASSLGFPTVEGDTLHSRMAVDKMAAGVALTDDDRASWLDRVGSRAIEAIDDLGYHGVVVTCSALKQAYRDTLRRITGDKGMARLLFVVLQCTPETLKARVTGRTDHYMPPGLVESQMLAYEGPGIGETDVIPVDAEADAAEVFERVRLVLGEKGVDI